MINDENVRMLFSYNNANGAISYGVPLWTINTYNHDRSRIALYGVLFSDNWFPEYCSMNLKNTFFLLKG